MSSVFVWLARRGSDARRSLAAELAARPLRIYRSRHVRILDPAADFTVDCEPVTFRQLAKGWPDRDTSDQLTEAVHRMDLERAAQPVIEVTVTTPPGGIPRAALAQLVQARMAQDATRVPDLVPAQASGPLRDVRSPRRLPLWTDPDATTVFPAVRDDDTQIIEVRVP